MRLVRRSFSEGGSMARWARLELATDGLEIRCSVLLSYHRNQANRIH
jgi:hypothetical protein